MTKLEEFKEWLEEDENRKGGIGGEEWEAFFSQHEELLNCDWEDEENKASILRISIQGRNEQKMFDIFYGWLTRAKESEELIREVQRQEEVAHSNEAHTSSQKHSENERTRFKKWWLFGLAIAVGVVGIGLKVHPIYPKEEINDFKKCCATTFNEVPKECERAHELLWKKETLIKTLKTQIRDKRIKVEKLKNGFIGKSSREIKEWEVEELSCQQGELSRLEEKLEILQGGEMFKEIEGI